MVNSLAKENVIVSSQFYIWLSVPTTVSSHLTLQRAQRFPNGVVWRSIGSKSKG